MDIDRMLEKCKKNQWSIDDLDWSVSPKHLSREDEMMVVQYFTDMAGIELLAAQLFRVQRKRTENPILQQIFDTFIEDEIRHSKVAKRLASFYNVHSYKKYKQNPNLIEFSKHFIQVCQYLSGDIATIYITAGEVLLDIALLRSINDFVNDTMSQNAMDLINRDESRHIAIDYYMIDYYASEEYEKQKSEMPPLSVQQQIQNALSLAGVFYYAKPFFQKVFFEPIDRTDPSEKRLKEAFKRIQLLAQKQREKNTKQKFTKFVLTLQSIFNHPIGEKLFGSAIQKVLGVDARVIRVLYNDEDLQSAKKASIEEMAEETLNVKYKN